jgi:hypothetical protein
MMRAARALRSRGSVAGASAPAGAGCAAVASVSDLSGEIIVRSGRGGLHAYYKHSGEGRKIRPNPSQPIDILGGGVVVLPPSLGAERSYEIIKGHLDDLIALTKAHPGQINYASSGIGSASHLSPELFKSMAGIDLTHIPYKGTGPMISELIGGQLNLTIASAAGPNGSHAALSGP